jgi:hypothetical protein
MSLHDDLLEQSKHLLGREPRRPKQASLRRAISSAYYSLFHLLTYEACKVFVDDDTTIKMLVRSYDHGKMSKVSRSFAKGDLPGKLRPLKGSLFGSARQPTVDRLKSIAQAFVDLQDARHLADYDLTIRFARPEAKALVDLADSAFSDWNLIRKDDLARIYLSCFLVFDDRNKER